jgi:hypothetical protein
VNAGLYRLFGPSLDALYADGIVTAIAILALVYWIGRRLMGRAAATVATLEVMWLCAFKQAGNYFLPYSYSALHGCAFGLLSLALVLKAVGCSQKSGDLRAKRDDSDCVPSTGYLMSAGAAAGLAILAKTEMGLAAVAAGTVAAWLAGQPRWRQSLTLSFAFSLPALTLVFAVYGAFAMKVGLDTLSRESFLFFQHLPEELIYFNKRMSGFDDPLTSLALIFDALVRIVALGMIVAAISLLATSRRRGDAKGKIPAQDQVVTDAGGVRPSLLWALLAISVGGFLLVPLGGMMNLNKGPYLAMPVLLVGFLISGLKQHQESWARPATRRINLAIITISVFALASLARVLLRVRSGGAYSSYLLPASVILFTYLWVYPFASLLKDGRARHFARRFMIILMIIHATATGALLVYRYRTKSTHTISTARGTMLAPADATVAINEAIGYINRNIRPGEPVAVLPEGTSINFLADRPNPLREEILTPGFLDREGEERAIRQLEKSGTRLVLIANRATSEFGPSTFGRDYNQILMRWIEENFKQEAVFGPSPDADLQIGDPTFFIRAYLKE